MEPDLYPSPEMVPIMAPPLAIIINDVGPHKIQFIKLVRQVSRVDLVDAKRISELPTPFVLSIQEATIAGTFRDMAGAAGATCELRDPDESMQPVLPVDRPFDVGGVGKAGCVSAAALLLTTLAGVYYLIATYA